MKNLLLRGQKLINNIDVEILNKFSDDSCYFRFQCIDWEVGTQSFGMIYSSAEEAIEDGSTVLDGKSCVDDWRKLYQFMEWFNNDFPVMVFKGEHTGYGHDGEDVVIPEELIACIDYNSFCELVAFEHDKDDADPFDFMC